MAALRGRRALVVGASSGIGAAVARAYAAAGASVCLTYKDNRTGAEAAAEAIGRDGGRVHVLRVDAATREGAIGGVDAAAEALGGLDILVNNAGAMFGRVPLLDVEPDRFAAVVDCNVGSVLHACQRGGAIMRAAGGGCIVNTTSIAARTGGGAGVGLYGAAKSFVSTLTRVLARELAADGVRVNAVAPGTIDTPFHARDSTAEQLEAVVATIPMGRLGTPEDCVGAYLFLADPAMSGYVTGQVIEVNGGQAMP